MQVANWKAKWQNHKVKEILLIPLVSQPAKESNKVAGTVRLFICSHSDKLDISVIFHGYMFKVSPSNTIFFLIFQIIQNTQYGAAFHAILCVFSKTQKPYPKHTKVSLTVFQSFVVLPCFLPFFSVKEVFFFCPL